MYKIIITLVGLSVLLIQAALSVNTMSLLSGTLPSLVAYSMMALAVMFELAKPLLTVSIHQTDKPELKVFSGVLLFLLSGASIFATHYTMQTAVSDSLSRSDEKILTYLDKEHDAYLKAIETGVISATTEPLKMLSDKSQTILDKEGTLSEQIWVIVVSVLAELLVIACFTIASLLERDSVNDENKDVHTHTSTISVPETYDHADEKDGVVPPNSIRGIMSLFKVGYAKAKLINDIYGDIPHLQVEDNTRV